MTFSEKSQNCMKFTPIGVATLNASVLKIMNMRVTQEYNMKSSELGIHTEQSANSFAIGCEEARLVCRV